MDYKNFCPLPFVHLSNEPNGSVRPCCIYDKKLDLNEKKAAQIDEVPLDDLFIHPHMIALRKQFLADQQPAGCASCFRSEASGQSSKRLKALEMFNLDPNKGVEYQTQVRMFAEKERKFPTYLQIILSNLCNLNCRTCNPVSSTKWIKEARDRGLNHYKYQDVRDLMADDSTLKEKLPEWASHLEIIEIMGGEPMLQTEVRDLLQFMAYLPNASKMKVFLSTNGTQVPFEWLDRIKNSFQFLGINFSLDGTEKQFEYLRHGANWSTVIHNIKRMYDWAVTSEGFFTEKMTLGLQVTVSWMNVFEVPKIMHEFSKSFPQMKMALNIVKDPYEYSPYHLPEAAKEKLKVEYSRYRSNEVVYPQLKALLKEMTETKGSSLYFKIGCTSLMDGDRYRGEDFLTTFPDLAPVIEKEWEQAAKKYTYYKLKGNQLGCFSTDFSLARKSEEIFKRNLNPISEN